MRDEKFFKVDLHLHTPSSNDYRGQKNEDEYLNIVNSSIKNNIDLICITDHFSVNGFREIINKRNSLANLIQQLRARNDSDPKFIKKIEDELNTFSQVHILLGIEIKVSPGIHYIIVFDETVIPDHVEKFFIENFGEEVCKCFGSSDYLLPMLQIDFFNLVKTTFHNKCFIYAPHADSDSGVIEGLKKFGKERLEILNNENLLCIGFNKEKTKDYLKQNLLSERKHPINFIQDSDFHGGDGEKVGSLYFLIENENEKICFNSIVRRLQKNKDVVTSSDKGKEDYEEFKKNKIIIPFENFDIENISEEKVEQLCVSFCALLNSENGYLEFDVNIGEQIDAKSYLDELLNKLNEIIEKKTGYFPYRILGTFFIISKSKFRIVLDVGTSDHLRLYKGICYHIDKEKKVRVAESHEIESIVSKKIYKRFERNNDSLLEQINSNSTKMTNFLESLSLFYKIENKIKFLDNLKFDFLEFNYLDNDINEIIKAQENGFLEGNLIVISRLSKIRCGRFPDSYLRISPPTFNCDLTKISEKNKTNLIDKNSIIVSLNGACYLCNEQNSLVSGYPIFKISDYNEVLNPLLLISYLKSTFLQWYLCKIFDYDSFFDFCIKTNTPYIPIIKGLLNEGNDELLNFSRNILIEEKNFLKEYNKNKNSKDQIGSLIKKHNNRCDDYFRSIDKNIFKLLEFSNSEILKIFNDVKKMDIYEYNSLEKFADLYE
jgi:hypothetical protein